MLAGHRAWSISMTGSLRCKQWDADYHERHRSTRVPWEIIGHNVSSTGNNSTIETITTSPLIEKSFESFQLQTKTIKCTNEGLDNWKRHIKNHMKTFVISPYRWTTEIHSRSSSKGLAMLSNLSEYKSFNSPIQPRYNIINHGLRQLWPSNISFKVSTSSSNHGLKH